MNREELRLHVIDTLAGKVTCKEFTEAITDYLEGKLSFLFWLRFQMHLGMCLGCRIYLRQMKQTINKLGHLPNDPIPPAVREELLQRFRTWKTK
ncbi:MAG: zf-HC2 domain-containing protein [Nitrospirae bacterium]|nr:zf-HC2 domain-containing protein [Nitrospirota bacterium]